MVSVVGGLLSKSALRGVGGEERPQGPASLIALGKGQVGAHTSWMQARFTENVAAHWSKDETTPTFVRGGPGILGQSAPYVRHGSPDLEGDCAPVPFLDRVVCTGAKLEPHKRGDSDMTASKGAAPRPVHGGLSVPTIGPTTAASPWSSSLVPAPASVPCSVASVALTTNTPTSTSSPITAALPATQMCSSRFVYKDCQDASPLPRRNYPAPKEAASECAHVTDHTSTGRAAVCVPGITNASHPGGCVTAGPRRTTGKRRRHRKSKGVRSKGRYRYGAKGRSGESGPVHGEPESDSSGSSVSEELPEDSRRDRFAHRAEAEAYASQPSSLVTSHTGTTVKRSCFWKLTTDEIKIPSRRDLNEMGNIIYPVNQASAEWPVTLPTDNEITRECLTFRTQTHEADERGSSTDNEQVPIPSDQAERAMWASAGGHVLDLTGRARQAGDNALVAASGSWMAGLPPGRAPWPQCPAPRRASHPCHYPVRTAASCHVSDMNSLAPAHSRVTAPDTPPDGHPPPPEPPPAASASEAGEGEKAAPSGVEDAAKGHSHFMLGTTCGRGQLTSGLREDIRAFDIYKITGACETHVPPLPALPTQSDTDTDTDEGSTGWTPRALRKRKINPEVRDGVERKRYRESEDEEDEEDKEETQLKLEGVTLLLPSPMQLHSDFNKPKLGANTSVARTLSCPFYSPESCPSPCVPATTTSIAPPSVMPPETSAPDTGSATAHSDSTTLPSTTPPISIDNPNTTNLATTGSAISTSRACYGVSPLASSYNSSGCEDADDNSSEDTLSDDDDGASTVVPDDFWDETDSDIEVLVQSESWVDLSNQPSSPDRVTPLPFGNGEEYLRLLREAQKDSNQSSARVSLASSRRDTPRDSPHDSPKSPPNSPNTEMATDPEEAAVLKGVYINYYNKEGDFIRVEKNTETDWIWDWSSRPDQTPPKEWRFSHPRKGVSRGASIRRVMVGNSSLFSRDVLYTLLITNVLSLILGTGIGIWLSKRSGSNVISTLPIN
ncbi:flocculation protein FLO11-like isoform X2 [Penaeus japonicus]|nr:flocculation protein FLO11-like isoform X2 [Penaeus japonicus]